MSSFEFPQNIISNYKHIFTDRAFGKLILTIPISFLKFLVMSLIVCFLSWYYDFPQNIIFYQNSFNFFI